jgi:sugar O-acyltransferase (sialic acid O-acetyltransferase NeuD family)
MKQIVIVGAGGMGREIIALITPVANSLGVALRGFVDDHRSPCEAAFAEYPIPILSTVDNYHPLPDDQVIIAIGEPKERLLMAERLRDKGVRFFSFIHPMSVIASDAQIGVGVIIYPFCLISANTRISDFVVINTHSGAGHDVLIGEGSVVCAHADLTGWVEIGKGVLVGSHSSIIPKVKVGNFARIGAGSTVVRSVKENTTLFSQPARTLRK